LKESVHFTKEDYPGYINRRGAPPNAGETFFLGVCRTYKFVLGPDFLYKREIMAIQVVLPNISSEVSAENFKGAILDTEPQSQVKMVGEMAKADAEISVDYLKMLADKEFARQRIHHGKEFARQRITQAWRVKATIAEQLDDALDLKEDAFKRKETILKQAILELQSKRQARKDAETEKAHLEELNENDELKRQRDTALLKEDAILRKEACLNEVILELESERRAREDAEREKADLEASLNHLKIILVKELDTNDESTKQRDEALRQREESGREKRNTAIHLQKGMMPSLVSHFLAFALSCKNKIKGAFKNALAFAPSLFHKCKNKIKRASKDEQGCKNNDCMV
jgi:hypothetical protein